MTSPSFGQLPAPSFAWPLSRALSFVANSFFCVSALFTGTSSLSAQQPLPLEDTVTVSANRQPASKGTVGSSVTVVEREEIERRNPLLIADLLRTIPGVEITQSGGPGQVASLRVRGGTAAQVLVLLDGVRINTVTNGDVDFSHLDASTLERVEVLRGPQAAYGSEAMSGVISLTTKRGTDGLGGQLKAEVGSRDHRRVEAGVSGGKTTGERRLHWRANASDIETDAVSQLSPERGGTENDPYENRTYAGSIGGAWSAAGAQLRVHDYQGNISLDGFGVEDFNATASTSGRTVSAILEAQPSERWLQTLRLAQTETDILGEDPDTFFSNYAIGSETLLAETQADVALNPSHTLNIGLSHEERDGFNRNSFDESAELQAAYLQYQWSSGNNLHLTAGARSDEHSVFGSETSYRATGSAAFAQGKTRVLSSYGTAFRAPNFNELYFPFAGDPTLRPETSTGWDVGLVQRLGARTTLDLSVFDLRFDDLIQFDLDTFLFGNIADASSSGVEATLRIRPTAVIELSFAHTFNDTEDRATGKALARRPRHRTVAIAQWSPRKRISASIAAFSVRDRIDSNGLEMDNYVRVDLSLRYRAADWITPFLRAESLFDESYEEVPGFTTPGATVMAGVSLRPF